MANKIGAYDAKTNLPKILRRVEEGEAFTITNRGKPIADIIPSSSNQQSKTQSAIKHILESKKYPISNEELSELKEQGRK